MTAYNPIAAMNRLKAAGLPAKQSEALAQELQGAIETHVTKEELSQSLAAMKADLTATIWTAAAALAGIGLAALSVAVSLIAR
ncbi:hypothetical protein [Sphingobium fluviale]|uniref:DUF1640 domain-containing protein n=1 Tax=Sphingobium fluviale TaxID=2506423 RepID=A0A4Q1KHE8_9SPHN|nr:hypothetical protein [Sphingobium fluviale]RXR28987.1 hypothetical protein EQG66_07870 [Sphingobium fluviale]